MKTYKIISGFTAVIVMMIQVIYIPNFSWAETILQKPSDNLPTKPVKNNTSDPVNSNSSKTIKSGSTDFLIGQNVLSSAKSTTTTWTATHTGTGTTTKPADQTSSKEALIPVNSNSEKGQSNQPNQKINSEKDPTPTQSTVATRTGTGMGVGTGTQPVDSVKPANSVPSTTPKISNEPELPKPADVVSTPVQPISTPNVQTVTATPITATPLVPETTTPTTTTPPETPRTPEVSMFKFGNGAVNRTTRDGKQYAQVVNITGSIGDGSAKISKIISEIEITSSTEQTPVSLPGVPTSGNAALPALSGVPGGRQGTLSVSTTDGRTIAFSNNGDYFIYSSTTIDGTPLHSVEYGTLRVPSSQPGSKQPYRMIPQKTTYALYANDPSSVVYSIFFNINESGQVNKAIHQIRTRDGGKLDFEINDGELSPTVQLSNYLLVDESEAQHYSHRVEGITTENFSQMTGASIWERDGSPRKNLNGLNPNTVLTSIAGKVNWGEITIKVSLTQGITCTAQAPVFLKPQPAPKPTGETDAEKRSNPTPASRNSGRSFIAGVSTQFSSSGGSSATTAASASISEAVNSKDFKDASGNRIKTEHYALNGLVDHAYFYKADGSIDYVAAYFYKGDQFASDAKPGDLLEREEHYVTDHINKRLPKAYLPGQVPNITKRVSFRIIDGVKETTELTYQLGEETPMLETVYQNGQLGYQSYLNKERKAEWVILPSGSRDGKNFYNIYPIDKNENVLDAKYVRSNDLFWEVKGKGSDIETRETDDKPIPIAPRLKGSFPKNVVSVQFDLNLDTQGHWNPGFKLSMEDGKTAVILYPLSQRTLTLSNQNYEIALENGELFFTLQ